MRALIVALLLVCPTASHANLILTPSTYTAFVDDPVTITVTLHDVSSSQGGDIKFYLSGHLYDFIPFGLANNGSYSFDISFPDPGQYEIIALISIDIVMLEPFPHIFGTVTGAGTGVEVLSRPIPTVQTIPGPLLGSGLPALMMLLAWWLKSRRQ